MINKKEENKKFSHCNFSQKNRRDFQSAIFLPENRKGVSPVIATVLLIGLVITLGIVVFVWFQSFTQEAVTKFDGQNIELTCGEVQFEAGYASDGDLAVSNTGNVPIFSFNVQINKQEGAYTTEEMGNLIGNWPAAGLKQGGVFSENIASKVAGATQIILIPILRGTVSSGDQKSFTCGNQYGQSISI
jgi:flagellin-like protein